MPQDRIDIRIDNGLLVTCDSEDNVIKNGWIAVQHNEIVMIGKTGSEAKPDASDIIDAEGGIVMPGLINTHTHLPMSLFRGLADDLPLMEWLNNHIFPREATHINPESVYMATLLSCAEMLLSGTTTCCDGYFYEDSVAEAVRQTGMRAVLGHGVIDYPAPGIDNPDQNVAHALAFTEKWMGRTDLIIPSIFCHSAYTCSENTLKKAKAAADQNQLLFQIHAAETAGEKETMLSNHGVTPLQYLDRIGVLDENTLIVHGVWMDAMDIKIVSTRKAKISHCPESNMKLGSGIAPVQEQLNAGITVGIGTDSCASNNDLDMLSEIDCAAKLQKVKYLDPTILDAKTVLKMATIDGAGAIGIDHLTGSLEPGKQADMIIVDIKKPHMIPMYNPFSHLVYSARGSDVRDVMVAGRMLMRNRKLLTIDMNAVAASEYFMTD
ncbi:MAG: amidohydrolase [Deltaproteobacteria bacterium]|nr:amidohydrolase [Deltaproteobacteria bacterium]MBW2219714.1 amidohydrolase [Deltaproteobacteria bacterium]